MNAQAGLLCRDSGRSSSKGVGITFQNMSSQVWLLPPQTSILETLALLCLEAPQPCLPSHSSAAKEKITGLMTNDNAFLGPTSSALAVTENTQASNRTHAQNPSDSVKDCANSAAYRVKAIPPSSPCRTGAVGRFQPPVLLTRPIHVYLLRWRSLTFKTSLAVENAGTLRASS